jgi:antitoxin component YwqK of YwqJK toxin-antitoxin module
MYRVLIFILLIVNSHLSAQIFQEIRNLRPMVESNDTTYVMVKRNKLGEIIKLSQEYNIVVGGEVFLIEENYKKDKYWDIWRYKEVTLSRNRKKLLPDGKQFHYSDEGRLIGIQVYNLGEKSNIHKEFNYYPNGKIKFIAEIKNNRYWNFILYKYPDGNDFMFGSFKDGKGTFIMLDNYGSPCETYKTIKGKLKVMY